MPNNSRDENQAAALGQGTAFALRKQLDYLLRVFAKDYFVVLMADFEADRVDSAQISEPVVPLLAQTLSKTNTYRAFLDFYCGQYVCLQDREALKAEAGADEVRRRLAVSGTFSISVHNLYQGRNCPAEMTFIDVSDGRDGSSCIIAVRFIEDVVRQQTALKKQDDMVKTLVQDYNAIYHIDLDANTFVILQAHNVVNEDLYDYAYRNLPFEDAMNTFIGKHPVVTIRGYGQGNVPDAGYRLKAGDPNSAACQASRKAYAMSGLTAKDIGCAEIYDCFTYTVEATLADYGFYDRKKSADFLRAEDLGPGGKFPLNTSGGMLSEGYFMGMTPVVEGVMQMMGRCGDRQLGVLPGTKMPEFTICSDNGGYLQSHETLILERSK